MSRIKSLYPFFLVIGLGLLLYFPSLFFGYTHFDDNVLIRDNQEYLRNPAHVTDAFRKTVFITSPDVYYRPVETVWFILNAQIGGENLFIYHLSALFLHLLAACLVFVLLQRLNASRPAALLLSLILLVHPALAQAVAWVPGSVDLLLTVFSIGAFLFFIRYLQTRKAGYAFLHFLFFMLALYTKETAVALVPVSLFYLHFIKKEKPVSDAGKLFWTGWVVLGGIWYMMRESVLNGLAPGGPLEMIRSMVRGIPALVPYIGKVFFPFNLSVMPVLKDTSLAFGICAILFALGLILFSKGKRVWWVFFGTFWFVVFLLPTFIQVNTARVQQFYEHRMYLPLAGALIFLAETDWIKTFSPGKKVQGLAAAAGILFFSALTFFHEKVFSDTKPFLENAVRTSPDSPLAHRNFGIYLQDRASTDKNLLKTAEREYLQALALNPQEKDLHNNLGVIYDSWNRKDSAEKEYIAEINLNPSNPLPYHNLGVICANRNENDKAEQLFKKAIAIRPDENTYRQLAMLYKKMGRERDFEKAAMMLPKDTARTAAEVYPNAADSDPLFPAKQLMQAGKMKEAEKVFKAILAKDSTNAAALFYLGIAYYSEKRLPEAESAWRESVRHDSAYTDAFNNLAICLAQQGKNEQAEYVLRKLVSANPDYIDGYFNAANFYARLGQDDHALFFIGELKKKGITKKNFLDRGIAIDPKLEKLFDQ